MVPFCWAIGSGILGNESASGTEIIERLGAEHMRTGKPIVYTSADSVFQIAAHEEVVATKRLYEICQAARGICDRFQIGRVIARPFLGSPGNFVRTERRRDFSIALPEPTILDSLSDAGVRTVAVGKIGDIFNQQGISENYPEKGNPKCLNRVLSLLKGRPEESFFMFVNLVDTDMIFGHRRDPTGYHEALAAIDVFIPRFVELMDEGDLLIISADHGCDPTFRGNDHTREYVPLLALRKGEPGKSIGVRESFADHAQSIAQFFSLSPLRAGESFIERPTSNVKGGTFGSQPGWSSYTRRECRSGFIPRRSGPKVSQTFFYFEEFSGSERLNFADSATMLVLIPDTRNLFVRTAFAHVPCHRLPKECDR